MWPATFVADRSAALAQLRPWCGAVSVDLTSMSVLPTRSPDPLRATSGTSRRSGRPRRPVEPADAIQIIDRSLVDAVARQFPDMWEDLSDDGRDMFVRGLMEAASRPLDDRVQAVAEVIDSWQTAWSLLYAPVDDEPLTPEDAAAADAALESLRQGHGILLNDLVDESETGR